MFDKMQYVIDCPAKIKWGEYKAGVRDINGKLLGNVLYKAIDKKQVRFEDDHGTCHGIIMKKKIKGLSNWTEYKDILGPLEDIRGRIEIPYWGNLPRSKFSTYYGPRILYDISDCKIATSSTFTIKSSFSSDYFVTQFEHLRRNGLDFKTPDGAIIATIRDSKGMPGCQVDFFPPIPDGLLIFSLVVQVLI
jgi:hypothetical protein